MERNGITSSPATRSHASRDGPTLRYAFVVMVRTAFGRALPSSLAPYPIHIQLSFGIGASLTGVPFHFHGAGFQEVFHGSKLWMLQARPSSPLASMVEGRDWNPEESVLRFVMRRGEQGGWWQEGEEEEEEEREGARTRKRRSLPSLAATLRSGKVLPCVIVPGETIYFPRGRLHAILNVGSFTSFVSSFTNGEDVDG